MIAQVLELVGAWIVSVISAGGYGGVMLLMAIESACIPLPSEIIMPFSGYLVYTGRFSLLAVATWGAIGCNLGSVLAYEIGYYGGRPLALRYGHYIFVTQHELNTADRFFVRWGSLAVLIARLLPVIRTFLALPAGIARMPRLRLHVYRIVAVVLCAGVRRDAARRAVRQGPATEALVPSHGRRDSGSVDCGSGVFRVVAHEGQSEGEFDSRLRARRDAAQVGQTYGRPGLAPRARKSVAAAARLGHVARGIRLSVGRLKADSSRPKNGRS